MDEHKQGLARVWESLGLIGPMVVTLIVVSAVMIPVLYYFLPSQDSLINAETISAGVVAHRSRLDSWIQNTNNHSVRVRRIEILENGTEMTEWIKVLEPKNKIYVAAIKDETRFYVYTMEGVGVGFIKLNPKE